MAFEEIVVGPMTAYVGAVLATARVAPPDIDATTVASGWVQIGKSGAVNYEDDGVAVAFRQSLSKVRGAASSAPIKIYRTEEDVEFSLMVRDIRMEMLTFALNGNVVTPIPSTASKGNRIHFLQGVDVTQGSLLLRGLGRSPYGDSSLKWALQFYIPLGVMAADEVAMGFGKENPVEVNMMFTAMLDTEGVIGSIDLATAANSKKRLGWITARNAA